MVELRQPEITSTASERDAYNIIYEEIGVQQSDSFYLWLLELLNVRPNQTLLDISCGQGNLVRFAWERNIRAIGIDLSEVGLQIAMRQSGQTSFAAADAQLLPVASHSFDFVTNIGSIEHYLDPAMGVQEIARVLKPDGLACILLPNTYSLLGNIKHVVQTGDVYQGFQPIERYHTLNGWRRLLTENGLRPIKTVKYEKVSPRTSADTWWYLRHPPKLLHLLLTPLIPLALANCFVYLCRRQSDFDGDQDPKQLVNHHPEAHE